MEKEQLIEHLVDLLADIDCVRFNGAITREDLTTIHARLKEIINQLEAEEKNVRTEI